MPVLIPHGSQGIIFCCNLKQLKEILVTMSDLYPGSNTSSSLSAEISTLMSLVFNSLIKGGDWVYNPNRSLCPWIQ